MRADGESRPRWGTGCAAGPAQWPPARRGSRESPGCSYPPAGYTDDGLTCRRDAKIINADNSQCPWYDRCGLTLAKGCTVCPAGYANDGCTCRIDANIFGKSSYGRGAGPVPTSCSAGQRYDAGLCYAPCASGYSGAGPVCWGSCPVGYIDFGATCTRVITK